MRERLTTRLNSWLDSPWMMPVLGVASFLESILVPIPLELILIPLMQRRRDRLWWLAAMALLGCVAGATVGYLVGYAFMETAGEALVAYVGQPDMLDKARVAMRKDGFWFIMTVSVVPIPFQIAMLAAGATGYPFHLYLLATLISRSIRYYGLALLVYFVGPYAEEAFRRHGWIAVAILAAVIIAAWIVVRWAL